MATDPRAKCGACVRGDCHECTSVEPGAVFMLDGVQEEDCCCFHLYDDLTDRAPTR